MVNDGTALTKAARAKKKTACLASILEGVWIVKVTGRKKAPGLRTRKLVVRRRRRGSVLALL